MSGSTNHLARRIELLDPAVVAILKRASPRQRWQMAFEANRLVRERIRAHLRHTQPDWTDAQIAAEIARRMLWNNSTSSGMP